MKTQLLKKIDEKFKPLFETETRQLQKEVALLAPNLISVTTSEINSNSSQCQTGKAFADKWRQTDYKDEKFQKALCRQKEWYLNLYGFQSESNLKNFLKKCSFVLDAGAGKGGKAAWMAELSPSTIIVAVDISDSIIDAAKHYEYLENMFFVKGDIADLIFPDQIFDYVSCDQVIHHTTDPYETFRELVRVTKLAGDISCYVYRKKALPRELLDDYFRGYTKQLSHEQLMELSTELTELGRLLSRFEAELDFPSIPVLGIAGGKMTIQRFLYWNFVKCFWNDSLGFENSILTNYDWYAPSQAFRYTEDEFRDWIKKERLREIYFHSEEACYSGRFQKITRKAT